ncbi:MAG: restriction endonuclease subunit S [Proteobacteria bacterium]|nr:restriction endonuclease subunit S [Pseudomonadota bacterium]
MRWPLIRLSEVCDINIGRTPRRDTPAYWGGPGVWVTVGELDGGVVTASKETISKKAIDEVMPEPVPPGTVLFSFKLSIGKIGVSGVDLYTNEAIAALPIKRPDLIGLEYLRYALGAVSAEVDANHAVLGKVLNKAKVGALEIVLPPLPEQQRIVDILDRAASIRKLRKQAEAKAQEIIPALFVDMFGDPVANLRGWPLKQLGEVGQLDRGRSRHRPRDAQELYGGPYPFIQTGDVAQSNGYIDTYSRTYSAFGLAQSKLWERGTLCITIAANIAKTGILSFDACFPDSVVGFVPKELVTAEYVRVWLGFLQPTLEVNAPQLAQKNINLEILRKLPIPIPKPALLEVFDRVCATLRTAHLSSSRATSTSRVLQSSLMQSVVG